MPRKSKVVKGRYWAFVAYPESLPANWLDILQQTGLKIAISPLHDVDLNADESEKKPHYHIICAWESGTTTFHRACEVAKSVRGTIPIKLEQIRGYYRYLTHEDNPEKAQYSKSEIKHLNGFNIADYVELTRSELVKLKQEIFNFIDENGLVEYADLIDALRIIDNLELFDCATSNTILFNNYLTSRRHEREKNGK